jgi:hypothetical protein
MLDGAVRLAWIRSHLNGRGERISADTLRVKVKSGRVFAEGHGLSA